MIHVRQATIEDLPKMEKCSTSFLGSSKFLEQFDMGKFVDLWTKILSQEIGVIFVLVEGEEIIGAIGSMCHSDAYSQQLIAMEMFWYVLPEHRGPGMKLYRAYENWAREKGCNKIRMTYLCDLMPEGLKTLYEDLGYYPIEVNYQKELKPWQLAQD